MWICAVEYIVEQFSDELAEESADPRDRATATHCEQSYSQSVNTTVTTTTTADAAAAAAAVCMETSFGLESDEPRTRVLHSTQSEHQLRLQLVPGLLIGCFSRGLMYCAIFSVDIDWLLIMVVILMTCMRGK